jgi:hypothetical protein
MQVFYSEYQDYLRRRITNRMLLKGLLILWSDLYAKAIQEFKNIKRRLYKTVAESSNIPLSGRTACRPAPPATKALHTTCYNLSIVSSSWWWAYKCPKHVELITRSTNHLVATSWFPSPHITTMHGQTYQIYQDYCLLGCASETRLQNVISHARRP